MSRDQEFKRAKERIALIAELNNHVRQSLTMIGLSAGLEQRDERLRRIDEAMARIDTVLTDLLPRAAGTGSSTRAPSIRRKESIRRRHLSLAITPAIPFATPSTDARLSRKGGGVGFLTLVTVRPRLGYASHERHDSEHSICLAWRNRSWLAE